MPARSIAMCSAVAAGPLVVENDTAIVLSDQPRLREGILRIEPPAGAQALARGAPLVARPGPAGAQGGRRNLTGGRVQHEGFACAHVLGREDGDVAVAPILAEQRDRVPEH